MSRLPLRLRLTLVFALAMAVVLVGVGVFVYIRLGAALVEQVDNRLVARATALAASIDAGEIEGPVGREEDEFAQILAPNCNVLAATPV
ncbi:MAG TPA: hypothetical protein VK923_04285 [Euzebyales bacterium]|nr:hypothetical protein [Euzebyales bacterium]